MLIRKSETVSSCPCYPTHTHTHSPAPLQLLLAVRRFQGPPLVRDRDESASPRRGTFAQPRTHGGTGSGDAEPLHHPDGGSVAPADPAEITATVRSAGTDTVAAD